jgi:hypothetical protein
MTGGSVKSSSSVRLVATMSATGAKAARTTQTQQVVLYGTGTARGDVFVSRSRTLAAGASETLDLFTGTTLLDPFDADAPFRVIRYVEVAITAGGDASGVRVGGAASDAWAGFFAHTSDMHLLFPTGPSYRGGSAAGVAVSSGAKNLKIENLGAVEVTYDIVLAGDNSTAGDAMGVLGLTYP